MKNKILSLCLSLIIVFGSVSFAFASPTTADQYAQYSGTGWSYNSSSHNFIANNQLSNSVPYVILSYLRDMYSQLSFDNSGYGYSYSNNTMRGIDITGSGKTSGGLYNIGKLIGLLNTNLMSQFVFTTNANGVPLYSWKNFIDTNLYSWGFSNGDFIDNFVNGIASVNNNVAYIANQLYSDSSNNRSLINQALHKIVDTTSVDYTTILNNIKNNTDYLSGIKTDTYNLSGIKTDTANLSAILTGINDFKTANHTDVTSVNTSIDNFKTANHTDITSFASANHTDITSFQNDFNDITWSAGNTLIYGYRTSLTSDYITTQSPSRIWYIRMQAFRPENYIYKITIPMFVGGQYNADLKAEFGYNSNGTFDKLTDCIITTNQNGAYTDIYLEVPTRFYVSTSDGYIKITSNSSALYVNPNGNYSVKYIDMNKQDFYSVNSYLFDRNILDLFSQAKEMFFDDESIQAKKDNVGQTSAVIDGFTADGDASASASDFGAVKDGVSNVKSGVDTNVSASSAFGGFNSEEGYSFFSQTTLNNLDTTNSNRRLLRSNSDGNSAYDDRLNAIYELMGVDHD